MKTHGGCYRDKADCKCPCCVTQATCMKGCVVGDKRGLLSGLLLLSHFKKNAFPPIHFQCIPVYFFEFTGSVSEPKSTSSDITEGVSVQF